MKVAILGGAGYLGSVIYTELINKGVTVDIYDNLMFCDEFAESHEVKVCDMLKTGIDYTKYDKIVWCMDIDVPEFYSMVESKAYINKNIKRFKELSEKLKDKLVWVTDYVVLTLKDPYEEMLSKKFDIAHKNKIGIVTIPSLYGPSPRMRFDTITNKMIATAIIESVIYVEDWMDTVNVQSVAVAGKTTAQFVIDGKEPNVEFLTMSMIELAHIVKSAFGEKILVLFSEQRMSLNGTRGQLTKYDKDTEFSIENSIKYMLAGIEHGVVDSIVKDMYNNSRIVSNYVSTGNMHTFVDSLAR